MSQDNVARKIIWPTDVNVLARVVFLYVGQGASAVVLAADGETYKVLLVDINLERKNGGIDVPRLITDLLDGQELEAFVNTHPHDDHLRGVEELSDAVDILAVWHSGHKPSKKYGESYEPLKKVIDKVKEKHGREAEVVLEGSRTAQPLGDAEYYVLSPAEYVTEDVNDEDADKQRARIHEQCAVMKFGKGDVWVMIPGDADRAAFEKHITEYHRERLPAVVLGAAHHGSRTFFKENEDDDPYTDALDEIDPKHVVISAPTQEESPHDHPHDDAVELYKDKVGDKNVFHTGEERNCYIFDIFKDGGYGPIRDDEGDLALEYALEENDGDDGRGQSAKAGPFVSPKEHVADRAPRKYG